MGEKGLNLTFPSLFVPPLLELDKNVINFLPKRWKKNDAVLLGTHFGKKISYLTKYVKIAFSPRRKYFTMRKYFATWLTSESFKGIFLCVFVLRNDCFTGKMSPLLCESSLFSSHHVCLYYIPTPL